MNFIVIAIIVANVLASYKAFNDSYFFRKYEFHIGSIRSGEQIRMFTSGFLHVDIQHLFFNMFTLFLFAPYVVGNLNNVFFLYIYFGSLVTGNLLTKTIITIERLVLLVRLLELFTVPFC